MNIIFKKIKDTLPHSLERRLTKYYSWFHYEEYDTSEGWRGKALKAGWQAIYWHNEYYNKFFDIEQKKYLREFLGRNGIAFNDSILDIGCGIGRLSKFFSDIGYKDITAVDFPEMIAKAQLENASDYINYISSPAQDFFIDKEFKLIISSGCFSAIRRQDFFFKAIDNCIKMQRKGGHILMIDPFHKNNYLAQARARISGTEMTKYMKKKGYELREKSGMLFFPTKILIANKWNTKESATKMMFYFGEKLLALFSKYYWSDYKILSFVRK